MPSPYVRKLNIKGGYDDIKSHSSILTNDRLSYLFGTLDGACMTALIEPGLMNIHKYFSCIRTIYLDVFVIMDAKTNDKLLELQKKYLESWRQLLTPAEKRTKAVDLIEMLYFCDLINMIIKMELQMGRYFFRTEARDAKDIQEGLQKMVEGGGIFGGTKLQGISRKYDEPVREDENPLLENPDGLGKGQRKRLSRYREDEPADNEV